MRWVAALVVLIIVLPATAPATVSAAAQAPPTASLDLVAVHPNPVAEDDRGEFVVLDAPRKTNLGRYSLTDGEQRVALPNRTVEGRVIVGETRGPAVNHTEGTVLLLDRFLSLSNAGEQIRLLRGNRTVVTVHYADAPEGETWQNNTWRPLAGTDRRVVHGGPGTAHAFVLPDAPGQPLAAVENATDRVLLAGYTFTSARATRALVAAHDRGATVRVLVDGAPVGGLSRPEAERLDRLAAVGIEVRVVAGPHAPYDFHHAKYVVADERATVLTENWKPAGTGGGSSRGWGVTLSDADAVDALAETFRADADSLGTVRWREFRRGKQFEPANATHGSYPTTVAPERLPYRNVSVLVAPDNAETATVRRLDRATDSIRVLQVSIGGRSQPFLAAAVRAARRGVEVRILLSSAWYVAAENRALAERVNTLADRESLPLSVRVATPAGQFEKVHAKGVVVDDTVLLGSLNWNNHSARENREVVVAIEGERVADYYASVFDSDWERSGERFLVGLPVALVLGAVACLLAARRLQFE
ncbi:phospholipase D-like domain-containing protein [Halorarius litoreus]|uniref:phospholipase D-like domain-containing protein n=1 Tax=Halorarius litoreus TaxID=2962676 RepID=UPI0020CEAEC1|nr:phospholipase D-like domain-containing protein [Halorarius litoreus]